MSIRVRGGERIEVIIVNGVWEGVPERSGYQVCAIVTKWVTGIDPLGFDGVAVTVLIDIELDVVRFLYASPLAWGCLLCIRHEWHCRGHSVGIPGVLGVQGVGLRSLGLILVMGN